MTNKRNKKEIVKIKKEWKNILFNTVFAVLTLFFVIVFNKNIILTTILLSIIAIIALYIWKSKITLIIFIIGAVSGTLAEMIAINYNVWSYSFTNFINIPIWLFVVWGNASSFIYQTALEIKKLGITK